MSSVCGCCTFTYVFTTDPNPRCNWCKQNCSALYGHISAMDEPTRKRERVETEDEERCHCLDRSCFQKTGTSSKPNSFHSLGAALEFAAKPELRIEEYFSNKPKLRRSKRIRNLCDSAVYWSVADAVGRRETLSTPLGDGSPGKPDFLY